MMANRPERSPTNSNEPLVFTAVLLAITLVLLAATFGLHSSAAMVPRAVGTPLTLLLCYRLIREMADRNVSQEGDPDDERGRKPDEIGAILWLLALPAVSTIVGFVAGPALYVFAWARFRAGERIAVAVAAAALTAAAIVILFVGLLRTPLPLGLLGALV